MAGEPIALAASEDVVRGQHGVNDSIFKGIIRMFSARRRPRPLCTTRSKSWKSFVDIDIAVYRPVGILARPASTLWQASPSHRGRLA
jgi:hypothetical protein